MKIQMEFELPFEECKTCGSFTPVVEGRSYDVDVKGRTIKQTRTLTCKGYTFCKYLKENVLGG